ncbi:hypothetical protein ACEQ8H_004455 [Pleosporales sp. CAS-2024a]
MSTAQYRSHLLCHQITMLSRGCNGKKQPTTYTDMTTLHRRTGGRQPHSMIASTQILHESKDNMPSITLTAYKEYSHIQSPKHLLQEVEFPRDDRQSTSTDQMSESAIVPQDDEGEHLSFNLNELWEQLKIEYQEKRGRAWTPLLPWDMEVDGEWVCSGELDDTDVDIDFESSDPEQT